MTRRERVFAAFAHREPDRTPLFEIFQPYQPIHWPICGRNIGTDQAMAWDAMSDGVSAAELVEAEARAAFDVARFFELDMVRLNQAAKRIRTMKLGEHEWELERQKTAAINYTRQAIGFGDEVVALGGDVSSDKVPFISPATYREFILPVIQEHVAAVHKSGALAVYTSDGNHWAIKRELFFDSGVDGYKEVDRAAGMTMDRLIEEGIDRQVCIIGNIDARHTLCRSTPSEVRDEVIDCLRKGQITPGGHILHASHSVHEDVKPENYLAAVNAYREYFGLPALSL